MSAIGKVVRLLLRIVITIPAIIIGWGVVCVWIGWSRAPELVAAEMAQADRVVRPSDLPNGYVDMLLAVEDPTFRTHYGFDLTTPGAGMTTITQGIAKFLYFHPFKPGWRKIPQTFYAIGLDARIPKNEILTLFLTRAGMGTVDGRTVYGFGDAAEAYFGKDLTKLTREQFLSLVAMCVGPNAFNVRTRPEKNRERVGRIERFLAGQCKPRDWMDVLYVDCASPRVTP